MTTASTLRKLMICTIWKAGVKSLFGSVCHEFLLKAAADAESCCALLMEASEMNFILEAAGLAFILEVAVATELIGAAMHNRARTAPA
jgi:hypothetical protein